MKGVFVTGSNTGVGKTTVAIEIVRHISKTRPVKVRKPVETNCEFSEKNYIPKDAIALVAACQKQEALNKVCPYCFEIEASAEVASADSGEKLILEDLELACKRDVDESFVCHSHATLPDWYFDLICNLILEIERRVLCGNFISRILVNPARAPRCV